MVRRHFGTLETDSTGRELFNSGGQGGLAFNIVANEFHLHRVVPHWHAELEVYLLVEGAVTVYAGGAPFSLSAGEGCFINTGVLHEFVSPGRDACHCRSFVFDSSIISGMVGSVFETNYVRPLLQSGPSFVRFRPEDAGQAFAEAFDRAFVACDLEPEAYEFSVRSALSDIILLAIRLGHVQSLRQAARVRDTLAKQMIAWIDRHLTEQVTLGDIAASVSVSPRECQRIFRQLLHRSPMNYLNMRRLYAAADALVSSSAPITDIALAYGFTSPSYFAQQFHRLLSLTPREYRNQYSRPFGG